MRRILATSLFAVIAGLWVAGCGGAKTAQNNGPAPIRVWHWMTDREDAFNELAKRYKEETGQEVSFELYAPTDIYEQKVRAAAQTDGLPEIYGILGEMRGLASFIQAGHVRSLEDVMSADNNAWRNEFFPKALAVNAFQPNNTYGVEPGVYGVPIDVMSIQLYYNKKLLAKLGLDPNQPPQTWEDFMHVGKLANDQGLIGFVSGWAELWLIDCYATTYAIHTMGMEKVQQTYEGQVAYTDPDWQRVFGLFSEMRDSGMLAEGIVTMVNKRAEQLFANEQAVFAFNGTWGINVYDTMNPNLDYGIMLPPRVGNNEVVTWGGAGSSFFVNAKSDRQDAAIAFLKWLTDVPQQKYLLEQTKNIPANRVAAAELPEKLQAFAKVIDAAVHPRLFALQEDSKVIETFDKGVQSILIGESTADQVSQKVAQAKEREASRQAKLAEANGQR